MGWGIEASAPAERRLRAELQGGRHFFLRGLREARSAGAADLGSGCIVVSLGLARRRTGTAAGRSSASAALASLRHDVLVSQHERPHRGALAPPRRRVGDARGRWRRDHSPPPPSRSRSRSTGSTAASRSTRCRRGSAPRSDPVAVLFARTRRALSLPRRTGAATASPNDTPRAPPDLIRVCRAICLLLLCSEDACHRGRGRRCSTAIGARPTPMLEPATNS